MLYVYDFDAESFKYGVKDTTNGVVTYYSEKEVIDLYNKGANIYGVYFKNDLYRVGVLDLPLEGRHIIDSKASLIKLQIAGKAILRYDEDDSTKLRSIQLVNNDDDKYIISLSDFADDIADYFSTNFTYVHMWSTKKELSEVSCIVLHDYSRVDLNKLLECYYFDDIAFYITNTYKAYATLYEKFVLVKRSFNFAPYIEDVYCDLDEKHGIDVCDNFLMRVMFDGTNPRLDEYTVDYINRYFEQVPSYKHLCKSCRVSLGKKKEKDIGDLCFLSSNLALVLRNSFPQCSVENCRSVIVNITKIEPMIMYLKWVLSLDQANFLYKRLKGTTDGVEKAFVKTIERVLKEININPEVFKQLWKGCSRVEFLNDFIKYTF